MKKQWILGITIWIIALIGSFAFGFYDNALFFAMHAIVSILLLFGLYKIQTNPLEIHTKFRKGVIDLEYARKIKTQISIVSIIFIISFILLIVTDLTQNVRLGIISMIGIGGSAGYLGLYFIYLENNKILKPILLVFFLLIAAQILVIIFKLGKAIGIVSIFPLVIFILLGSIVALYGVFKLMISIPSFLHLAKQIQEKKKPLIKK